MNHRCQTLDLERPEDARLYCEAWNATYPDDPMTVEECVTQQRATPDSAWQAYAAVFLGDHFIGVAGATNDRWTERPDRAYLNAYSLQGDHLAFLSLLYDVASELATAQDHQVHAIWGRSTHPARCTIAEEGGYQEFVRAPSTSLDLTAFDPKKWQTTIDAPGELGIRFQTLEEWDPTGRAWIRELHDATSEMIQDIPTPDPPSLTSLDEYERLISDRVEYDYRWMMVGRVDDEIVVYTRIRLSRTNPLVASTGLTGTRRTWRRKGLAVAIKVLILSRLKETGVQTVRTENHEANPMLQLNEALGFRHRFDVIEWEKRVR